MPYSSERRPVCRWRDAAGRAGAWEIYLGTSHESSGWLKDSAPQNIPPISVADYVFQNEVLPLKDVSLKNTRLMLATPAMFG